MIISRGKIISVYFLPVVTGILLWLATLPSDYWFLSFIAFIPFLFAADYAAALKRPVVIFMLQLFITLAVFFAGVANWILQANYRLYLIGFLIILPFVLFVTPYIWLKKHGSRYSPVYFISGWMAAEFMQSYFQLGSPFYNLGNNLGKIPHLIQWYEFTGATGGTIWILSVNFLLFSLLKALKNSRKIIFRKSMALTLALVVPVIISLIMFYNYHDKGAKSEVLIIHPGTDCTKVKYRTNIYELMDIYLGVMLPQLTPNTAYVVLPETAITNAGWVKDLDNNLVFDHFRQMTSAYPGLKLVTGAITYETVSDAKKPDEYRKIPGIRFSEKYKTWYYTYNAALLVQPNQPVQMRTKDGLVPYQEYAPYPRVLPRLSPVGIDFQFSKRAKNSAVFTDNDRVTTAALICYELVYGRMFARSVRHGARAFFVLLNEGWYIDHPKVPEQFLQLSVIRAIENRRSIAHTSNMGISAFINQRGEVTQRLDSKSPGFLKQDINLNRKITMASAAGNYLEVSALVAAALLIMNEFLRRKKTTSNR